MYCTRPQWSKTRFISHFQIAAIQAETRMNCLANQIFWLFNIKDGRCSSWVGSAVVKNEYMTSQLWATERKLWRNKKLRLYVRLAYCAMQLVISLPTAIIGRRNSLHTDWNLHQDRQPDCSPSGVSPGYNSDWIRAASRKWGVHARSWKLRGMKFKRLKHWLSSFLYNELKLLD